MQSSSVWAWFSWNAIVRKIQVNVVDKLYKIYLFYLKDAWIDYTLSCMKEIVQRVIQVTHIWYSWGQVCIGQVSHRCQSRAYPNLVWSGHISISIYILIKSFTMLLSVLYLLVPIYTHGWRMTMCDQVSCTRTLTQWNSKQNVDCSIHCAPHSSIK